jgi:hypothetical protein
VAGPKASKFFRRREHSGPISRRTQKMSGVKMAYDDLHLHMDLCRYTYVRTWPALRRRSMPCPYTCP